ncbi:sensor histidine kinase [Aromatoleum aromaticum]|uniref:sensor histidine kinase n=1 Tax=Aromatoleum aromaticum TaxID=551760 RepID=UPI002006E370|nr:HAMP domain-containing sensor histidine kinase [Aromatoleum aromaticum]
MTLLVSGTFSLGIVAIVHAIEEHLVSQEMDHELNVVLREDLPRGQAPRLASDTRFFASDRREYEIPDQFAEVVEGFSEIVTGDAAYYAYVREVDGRRYMLVQEQHEFETREQALFDVVLAGFLLSVAGAWGLGWMMARRVMSPVSRLAQQVRHRDPLLAEIPPLAPEYADDEIGQLAAAFDSTLGQLRQSLERERLFTSDVSHELRTPLMIIASTCELLEATHPEGREHEQVARIAHAAEEMRDLVQTFLLLARSRSEDAACEGTSTLAAVAEEQRSRWEPQIRDKGLDFELRVEGPDSARYHLALLRAVMSNLLRNALHYTDHGLVRLVLENGGFRVEDSGVGIPEDQRERMFQAFVRGVEARGEGLGLGLSLVKRICLHQGWRISVNSLAAGGSCFKVRLHESF